MGLSPIQLNILEEEVKSYMMNLEDLIEPNCVVKLNEQEIPIYFFLEASQSIYGDYEAPFDFPIDLSHELRKQLETTTTESINLDFDEFYEIINKIVNKYSPVTRSALIFRDVFGGTMRIYTTASINDQDWEKVIKAVSKEYRGYGNKGTLERNWPYLIEIKE